MTNEKTCAHCGVGFVPTGKNQKYCAEQCVTAARKDRHRLHIPEKTCEQCGATYRPRVRRQRFCSYEHGVLFASARIREARAARRAAKPKATVHAQAASVAKTRAVKYAQPASVATSSVELLSYILSDVIHSGSIPDEIERLREKKPSAIAALKAKILADLQFPTWPKDPLGRAALAIFLLNENPQHGRFLHGHEKRVFGYPKPTRLVMRPT